MGHKGPVLRPRCIGPGRARTQIPFIHLFNVRNFLDDKFPVWFGRNGFFRVGYNKVMSREKHCYVLQM